MRHCRGYVAFLLCLAAYSATGEPLSLSNALKMAKLRNGGVASSRFQADRARAEARSAFGSLLPSLTPSVTYQTGNTKQDTGTRASSNNLASSTAVTLSLPILDNGTRYLKLSAARHTADAQQSTYVNDLRQLLLNVHLQFFAALQAEETLKVQQTQLARAKAILAETEARVEAGNEAAKQVFQAKADLLNAEVSVLTSESAVTTNRETLFATIGLDEENPENTIAAIERPSEAQTTPLPPAAISDALVVRPDLIAIRKRISAAKENVTIAKMAGAVEFSLDAQWRKNFSRDVFRSSQIALTATVPLFDGGRSRESVRAQQDNVKALEASLKQAERSARSEIISTSLELQQNAKRLVVANAAFEAAKVNFDAASESRRLGAGTLLEVITAQLSLTTAESNLVQARYDYLSSKVRFDVATGKPIEGEE